MLLRAQKAPIPWPCDVLPQSSWLNECICVLEVLEVALLPPCHLSPHCVALCVQSLITHSDRRS